MKHIYSITVGLLLAIATVNAAGAAELKIGFVDVERISRESAPAERASKQLEKEFAPRQQELQRREAQIKELKVQLEREGVTLSESDRRGKEQELGRANVEFQRMQREFREDLTIRRNQEIQGLMERANRVIRAMAESEKFDLILQDAVYRNPRIDITDRVLKALAEGK
ncbi:MAG TPA: OmpH family outer membrane protein [Burkholderiales bacterium]|nr:OmpH family outer membrane protein [Burkholderiales bacterium]